MVTLLSSGTDPADWFAGHDGKTRLDQLLAPPDAPDPFAYPSALDIVHRADSSAGRSVTVLPARDLVRLSLRTAQDPIRDTVAAITPLTRWLGPGLRRALLEQASTEMTRRGWNPKRTFTAALYSALEAEPGGIPPPRRATPHPLSPELL